MCLGSVPIEHLSGSSGLPLTPLGREYGENPFGLYVHFTTGCPGGVADNATDLPAADVEGKEILHSVHTIGMFFEYSTQEMRSAARMSRQGLGDIIADKAASLRSDVDQIGRAHV